MILRKSPAELEEMAVAGAIHARCMDLLARKVRPGVTTLDLDRAAEKFIRSNGAVPSFKGYRGFTGSICASPNEVVVHGIPGPYRLSEGDVIAIDIGVTHNGWVADGACTFPVGEVDPVAEKLLDTTKRSLFAAVEAVQPGGRLRDVSGAVQDVVEAEGFSIVRELVGHGVGRSMHEEPQIPNYRTSGPNPKLEPGMVLAIEPMTTAGRAVVRMADDGWTIFTVDRSLSAHFEFTVAVTEEGPRILNPWHLPAEQRAPLAA